MKKPFKKTRRIVKRVPTNCLYCKQKIVPDYKETATLEHFITERGKIIPRGSSGVCQKHQRLLASSIKQARFLALIPYLVRPS
ncbi:30S ribosomal protein S18 [Candidatus Gottesmanbacteria bacterium]|nr:30S ribosomal protein S18 [Candidatus Gottesmanbacteria bacterium]